MPGSTFHGLLRVCVDILAQAVKRKRLSIAHSIENYDGTVLKGKYRSECRLHILIACRNLGDVDDGGISKCAVLRP